MADSQFEKNMARVKAIMEAMEPFARAASVAVLAEEIVKETDMTPITNLLGIAGYVGTHVAQSRVSWADWKNLLEAWNLDA